MKTVTKAVLGALALASIGAIAAEPASAQRWYGGGYYGGYYPGFYGGYRYRNPCLRPLRFRPGYCFRAYRPYAYGYGRPYFGGYYNYPYRRYY